MKLTKDITKISLVRRILISLGIAIFVFVSEYMGFFVVIDNYIFDLAYMQSNLVDLPISIIGIDDYTLDNNEKRYQDWSRNEYADLLEKLVSDEKYAPALIIFDIYFDRNSYDLEGDKRFAEIAQKYGRCIFGRSLQFEEGIEEENGVKVLNTAQIDNVGKLYPELEAINPMNGFTNNTAVYDKFIRTFIPYMSGEYTYTDSDGKEASGYLDMDSIDFAAYKFYMNMIGKEYHDFRDDRQAQYRFSYSGKPGNIPHFSFYDVKEGNIDLRYFKDQIVYIGAWASGFGDELMVPSDHSEKMYGVEIHANILEAMYDMSYQLDASNILQGIIYGLLAGIIFFVMCFLTLQIDAVIGAFFIVANLILGRILYENGIVINQFSFLLSVLSSYVGMVIHHYTKARAARNKISNAFKMYVAPQIVDEVAGQGDFVLNLGGRNKDIAVLFIDIRGFTTMSENLSPEEVVNILNEYFAVVTDAVFKNKGTIDKFIGDACMAVFNSPFDLDDYVYRAVHTGWDILQSGQKLQETLMEKYGRTINFGIGVNCGEAVIGNIGCEFRMDYTAIGDTVNTSSRLESNAKAGQLLISEEVLRRLDGRLTVEEIGAIPLKGKSKSIMVYNVVGIVEPEEVSVE